MPTVPGYVRQLTTHPPSRSCSATLLSTGAVPLQAWVQDNSAYVSYRISSSNSAVIRSCFTVNNTTGMLSTTCSTLDFVAQPLWTVLVDAVSQPASTLIDTARVFVSLSFVQQQPYLLLPPLLDATATQVSSLTIPESSTEGTLVGTVRGFARDAPITYTIVGSSSFCTVPPHTAFAVDLYTGVLTVATAGILDWEDCVSFTVLLNLSDTVRVHFCLGFARSCITHVVTIAQSLANWQITVGVHINLVDSPDAVITELRLAAGGEAAGLGVSRADTSFTP